MSLILKNTPANALSDLAKKRGWRIPWVGPKQCGVLPFQNVCIEISPDDYLDGDLNLKITVTPPDGECFPSDADDFQTWLERLLLGLAKEVNPAPYEEAAS